MNQTRPTPTPWQWLGGFLLAAETTFLTSKRGNPLGVESVHTQRPRGETLLVSRVFVLDTERVSLLGRQGVHSQWPGGFLLSAVESVHLDGREEKPSRRRECSYSTAERRNPLGVESVHTQRREEKPSWCRECSHSTPRGENLLALRVFILNAERVSPLGRRGVHSQRPGGFLLSAVESVHLDGREEKPSRRQKCSYPQQPRGFLLSAIERVYSQQQRETLSALRVYIPSTAERVSPLGRRECGLSGQEESSQPLPWGGGWSGLVHRPPNPGRFGRINSQTNRGFSFILI
ncbi:uncharacterized protein PGTG_06686 [Puccinia graminis f. sp. tritici CRL 75-36-700-3]|uniref:Uncharacterized protein n=1 Tax=Puccinia graminis f. sp. tritici (strain CRL 75-36-700-3 / race SCCL) TaxID=418459 RepID=E3K8B2_PUCGT|nr:uncharacterized protein PGTG_06686 [Puccinia graminis f. sp. tritici CRL 75-36-700-3]EFP80730.2 hypothetical protein PGTG_06686 [Puccinia graminis f. sp. tritici CRL 75-36-700-3]